VVAANEAEEPVEQRGVLPAPPGDRDRVTGRQLDRANRRPLEQLRAEFDLFWDDSLDRLSSAAQELERESSKRGR